LEHARARIGYVHGDAATVTTMLHSSAFGDTADINDQIYVPLARAFDTGAPEEPERVFEQMSSFPLFPRSLAVLRGEHDPNRPTQ